MPREEARTSKLPIRISPDVCGWIMQNRIFEIFCLLRHPADGALLRHQHLFGVFQKSDNHHICKQKMLYCPFFCFQNSNLQSLKDKNRNKPLISSWVEWGFCSDSPRRWFAFLRYESKRSCSRERALYAQAGPRLFGTNFAPVLSET